jgi:hypothetical protein
VKGESCGGRGGDGSRDPTTAHNPSKIFSIFQSLWKIPKTFHIIENTQNVANIVLILRSCGVKVSKIQVELLRGVGGDPFYK